MKAGLLKVLIEGKGEIQSVLSHDGEACGVGEAQMMIFKFIEDLGGLLVEGSVDPDNRRARIGQQFLLELKDLV